MKSTLSIAFALSFLTTVNATCYFPNGDATEDTPCNPDATHSTCCGPGYACLSNNVCTLTENVTPDIRKLSSYYVRASCTDKNWKSKECPAFCMNEDNGDNLGLGGMGMAKCDGDGSVDRYYCRNSQTAELSDNALCKNSSYHFDFSGFPTTVTIIGAQMTPEPSTSSVDSSSASSSPTPTPTPTSAPSAPSAESPLSSPAPASKKDSVALGAGLGVGLGLPLLVAIVAIALLIRRRRGSHTSELDAIGSPRLVGTSDGTVSRTPTEKFTARLSSRNIHEVMGDHVMHEAPSNQWEAHELSARSEWKAV